MLEPIQQPPERKPSTGDEDDGFVVMVETRPFERLSDDVVVCVLAWLGPRDLGRMAQVSKYFNRILRDKAFREWHRLKVRRVESRMAEVRPPTHSRACSRRALSSKRISRTRQRCRTPLRRPARCVYN